MVQTNRGALCKPGTANTVPNGRAVTALL